MTLGVAVGVGGSRKIACMGVLTKDFEILEKFSLTIGPSQFKDLPQ